MTDLSLFHRPSFGQKIQNIQNPAIAVALFAAMFAHSVRFEGRSLDFTPPTTAAPPTYDIETYTHFQNLAYKLVQQSLDESSEALSQAAKLSLLQGIALITLNDFLRGAHTRPSSLLGTSIQLAYELHLHLVDFQAPGQSHSIGPNLSRWAADEERRRCWWALWKIDNFSSMIRRCPTAINARLVETYLPVPDVVWFNNHFQASCMLESLPQKRAKALKDSGNESPDAWQIVISSIVRDAQTLPRGNIHGVLLNVDLTNATTDQLCQYFRNSFRKRQTQEDPAQVETLVDSLQTITEAIPAHLTYNGEYLDFGFDALTVSRESEVRCLHAAQYETYFGLQLAQFMIYHNHAFDEIVSGAIFASNTARAGTCSSESAHLPQGLGHCLQAADNICAIISQCPADHVAYVSPYLASTVWLAASLQILRDLLVVVTDCGETHSKYALLRAVFEQYSAFWGTSPALLENLDSLDARIRGYCRATATTTTSSPGSSVRTAHPLQQGRYIAQDNSFDELSSGLASTPEDAEQFSRDGCSSRTPAVSTSASRTRAQLDVIYDDHLPNLLNFGWDTSVPGDVHPGEELFRCLLSVL
ncbi:hypothetical protein ASPVEDRAFT_139885 [Aspergillus versicolor CBS 583.65]|uniref:Xylanolytic transcriptional activator regulatory domain-containing protein n=1 Tax=Aspergillus versicolor CBS 583.65 TaxID=1036611 RepID=A0A1L9PWM2_ASPVE|nr:uncharacterized protein ASPVEDRAFT_139885 [Aspergillus versicolor CBS 583.65]OJJ05928.1 hypothetical protein ASPVEDRAFT_139885 [Aspergillus versicolor CBS 583.65]